MIIMLIPEFCIVLVAAEDDFGGGFAAMLRGAEFLRSRSSPGRVSEGTENWRQGGEDDQHSHSATVRVLLVAVLLAEEWNPGVQKWESRWGPAGRSDRQYAVRGPDGGRCAV